MLRIWTAVAGYPKHEMSMVPSGEKPRWDSFLVDGVWSGHEAVVGKGHGVLLDLALSCPPHTLYKVCPKLSCIAVLI